MWHLLSQTSVDKAENLASCLEEHCLAVSWFEDRERGSWQLEAIFEEKPDQIWLQHLFKDQKFTLETVEEKDWLRQNRQDFPALEIGSFYVYGSHHEPVIPAGKTGFKIDAATAFGTGEHATTHGCLLALEDLKTNGLKVHKFLDLGCGTAILAMAMGRLFQCKGVASDNDPEAVSMAHHNVIENHLKDSIEVVLSQGFENPLLHQKFNLIAANILADPLIRLAPEVPQFLEKEGYLVLSGLLQTQQSSVEDAYSLQGLTLVQTYPQGEWTSLVFHH